MDKMQKSLENLVNILLDVTTEIQKSNDYEEISSLLPIVNDVTTNMKRMFDMGYIYSEEQKEIIDKDVEEKEVIEDA